MNKQLKTWMVAASVGALIGGMAAQAAVLFSDTFDSGNEGWGDRDSGEMAVNWTGGFGNGAGSMQGDFAAQGVPSPESDAFRLTGLGNLWTTYSGYSMDSFTFQFYAADVLPVDLIFRINGSGGTFIRSFSGYVTATDFWSPVTVSLGYSGWLGGTAAAFSNTLGSVNWVDIQVARNGASAQTYYFDNFALNGTLGGGGGGGGGGSAVPEPNTLLTLSMAGLGLFAVRRRLMSSSRT